MQYGIARDLEAFARPWLLEHNTAEEVWKEDYQRREAIEKKMLQ
jgi:hypothetical protein